MPTIKAPSNASNNGPLGDYQPVFEWCYTVQIAGPSWAGTYSRSPLGGKSGGGGADGRAVAHGGGIEGRITGGVVNARTREEVLAQLDETYIQRAKRKNDEGVEIEEVTHTYHLLNLEQRGIVSLS